MSGLAATPPAGPQGADHRHRAEEVVGQAVDRAAQFPLDAVHDDRGVRGDGAGMVGHQQGTALGRDLLQALPLGPEPLRVQRVVDLAGQGPHVLGAAPLVDVGQAGVLGGVGLDRRHPDGDDVRRRTGLGHRLLACRRLPACGHALIVPAGHGRRIPTVARRDALLLAQPGQHVVEDRPGVRPVEVPGPQGEGRGPLGQAHGAERHRRAAPGRRVHLQ